jgi:dTDP-4-amino-4,6-dideoxygalactose transaminase
MLNYRIPFNKACLAGNEIAYIQQSLANCHVSGDGPFSKKCHAWFEEKLGVKKAMLTTSGTHALEMMAFLLDIRAGDEVILPSFTFVSSVNAFVIRGARPVFIDIRPDTLNFDEEQLEALITPRTKAILVVHYAGVGCQMERILEIANRYQIPVLEDNAHGLFGKYQGRYLGTIGLVAAQSFHETKNITCGEGGALLINNPDYIEQAEILREKGTNRSRFFRGQVDKYTWVDVGSSYLPSDILAAFLYAQLEEQEQIQKKRQWIWQSYYDNLQDWADEYGIQLPFVPQDCEQPYHMFYLLLPSLKDRQFLIEKLKQNGILAVFHYLPLHLSRMGQKFGGKPGDCPVTEDISDRLLRLPLYTELNETDLSSIIEIIKQFKPQ